MSQQQHDASMVRRERVVRAIRRTSELEGIRSSDSTRADQDAYVRGEISVTQLGERVRNRYGLSS